MNELLVFCFFLLGYFKAHSKEFRLEESYAEEIKTLVINKDHSEILFNVPYMTISEVSGQFKKFTGFFRYTQTSNGKLIPKEINLVIKASSITTANQIRDGHLRGKDFFQTKKYPYIKYSSTNFQIKSDNSFSSVGRLSIKGINLPFSVLFSISKPLTDSWNKTNRFVKANFKIDRSKMNLNWNKPLQNSGYLVGKIVDVNVNLQMQPKGKLTAASAHMVPVTRYSELKTKLDLGEIDLKTFKEMTKKQKVDKSKTTNLRQKKNLKTNRETTKEVKTDSEDAERTTYKTNEISESKNWIWWVSFSFLCLMGFFGSFFLMTNLKIFIGNKVPNYDEIGFWGMISDTPTFIVFLLWALSCWAVGWVY